MTEVFLDSEGCFQALATVVRSYLKSEEEVRIAINQIINAVCAKKDHKPKLRLKILTLLFNLLTSSGSKFQLIKGDYEFFELNLIPANLSVSSYFSDFLLCKIYQPN